MTTSVVVKAKHGWPVRVAFVHLTGGRRAVSHVSYETVPNGEEREFHVHSHMDISVHEIQPDEVEKPA